MLNIFPWKLLKPRTPINKPGRHWFNGVTRALATMGVRVGKADESPHIERPNTDGSNWNIVLPAAIFNTNSGLVCRSFYLSRAGGASITVYQGRTKVPGDLLSLTCDGGKSYKTLSALPAGTNYIFVEVDENETTLTADHSQTLPVGKNQMVIGVVIVASGAITGIVQWYLSDLPGLGDKRVAVDKAATPDFIGTTAGDGVIRVGSGEPCVACRGIEKPAISEELRFRL